MSDLREYADRLLRQLSDCGNRLEAQKLEIERLRAENRRLRAELKYYTPFKETSGARKTLGQKEAGDE